MGKQGKEGISAFVIGLIFMVLNCIMGAMAFFGPGFLYGGILIIFPILGIVFGFKSIKNDNQRILGIIGLILNVINTLGALGLSILGIVSKFMS